MSITLNIKKLREIKEYSQEYMAYRLEASQATYCRLEKDEQKINLRTLSKIATILEMDLAEIIKSY